MQVNPGAQRSKQKNLNLFSWFSICFPFQLHFDLFLTKRNIKFAVKIINIKKINVLSNKLRNTVQRNPHFLNQKPNENSDQKFFPLNLFDYTLLNPNIPNSEFLKLVLIPLKVREIRIPPWAFWQ